MHPAVVTTTPFAQTVPTRPAPLSGLDLAHLSLFFPISNEASFRSTVQALQRAELDCDAFYTSWEGPRCIVLRVFASCHRLLRHAVHAKHELELDPGRLRAADVAANAAAVARGVEFGIDGEPPPADLSIPTQPTSSLSRLLPWSQAPLDPYEHIWAPFLVPAGATLEQVAVGEVGYYRVHGSTGSVLTKVDAVKLLLGIVEGPVDLPGTSQHGAGLDLGKSVASGELHTWFVAEDFSELHAIRTGLKHGESARTGDEASATSFTWLSSMLTPFSAGHSTQLKRYYGEDVGFGFAFQLFFLSRSWAPALIGLIVYVVQQVNNSRGVHSLVGLPVYGLIVALWSTLFYQSWVRHEVFTAQMWGMSSYRSTEAFRPAFLAGKKPSDQQRSFTDGHPAFHNAYLAYHMRMLLSGLLVVILCACSIALVVLLFWLRVVLYGVAQAQHWPGADGTSPALQALPSYITSVINSLLLAFLNAFFAVVARKLNDWEGHPTQTAYRNGLVTKLAVFTATNCYTPLIYIMAIVENVQFEQQATTPSCSEINGRRDCMSALESQLAIQLVVRFLINICFAMWPLVSSRLQRCLRRPPPPLVVASTMPASEPSPDEVTATLPEFDGDAQLLETVILYGYCALFAPAFPLAQAIVVVSILVELAVEAGTLSHAERRPVPRSADSIGAWKVVFAVLAAASIVTNTYLVLFTNTQALFDAPWGWQDKVVFFLAAEHAVGAVCLAVAHLIPNRSQVAKFHSERTSYLVAKHQNGVEDAAAARTGEAGEKEEAIPIYESWAALHEPVRKPGTGTSV